MVLNVTQMNVMIKMLNVILYSPLSSSDLLQIKRHLILVPEG